MNIVIDTNVVISGTFFGGAPRMVLESVIEQKTTAFATPDIIAEYNDIVEEMIERKQGTLSASVLSPFIRNLQLIEATSEVKASRDMVAGLFIIAYTQYTYMIAALGCGPRDTLLVGLAKRLSRLPIGAVSIGLLSLATLIGWLLGGPVGVGTLICAFAQGPIMQFAFRTVRFDAKAVRHQHFAESLKILFPTGSARSGS